MSPFLPLCLERFLASRTVIDFLECELADSELSESFYCHCLHANIAFDSPQLFARPALFTVQFSNIVAIAIGAVESDGLTLGI